MTRIVLGLTAAIVIALLSLTLTFSAAKLDLPTVDISDLPSASPPAEMSVSALPTGTYETAAALAFRGGSWSDVRQFSTTAFLVRHPKGNLLVDAGMGRNVDEHLQLIPFMQQKTTKHRKGRPVVEQLAAAASDARSLAAVIPTHAHWDHVSGIDDLAGVPVMINAAGRAFIDAKPEGTEVINSFRGISYQQYVFDGGPYFGFPKSHDVWGDGAVVIVPAPGHTPDSVIVFVTVPSGVRYVLLGDLVFQLEGIEIPAEKPWMLRRVIGEDDDEIRAEIARLRAATTKFPKIHLLPAHDGTAFQSLPVFPASAN